MINTDGQYTGTLLRDLARVVDYSDARSAMVTVCERCGRLHGEHSQFGDECPNDDVCAPPFGPGRFSPLLCDWVEVGRGSGGEYGQYSGADGEMCSRAVEVVELDPAKGIARRTLCGYMEA